MAEQFKSMCGAVKDTANLAYEKAAGVATGLAEKAGFEHHTGEKALLGYWSIRGIAGYIRLMLIYCNEPFEEKIYTDMPKSMDDMKKAREDSSQGGEWFREKAQSGLIVPNIPYLRIDGYKISQSRAIMRYLAKKHHLEGKNTVDQLNIDQIDEGLKDFLRDMAMVTYMTPKANYAEARDKYAQTSLQQNLGLLSKHLDSNHQYVAGNYVTYCDFILYEYLDIQRLYAPEVFNNFTNLVAYMGRIENLPRVKEYMTSGCFQRTPVFMPFSQWDGTNRNNQ